MKCGARLTLFSVGLLVAAAAVRAQEAAPPHWSCEEEGLDLAGHLVEGTSVPECSVCPEMVAVAGGVLERSNDPNPWVRGDGAFAPSHAVVVPPFRISRFEITNAQWRACIEDGGCEHVPEGFQSAVPDHPVVDIDWSDAVDFAQWLSEKSDAAYRLPTEAEWEFAARAGANGRFVHGDDPAGLCAYANHRAADSEIDVRNPHCADGFPDAAAPVGSLAGNALGLHDMLGNVWEWVEDCWGDADWPDKETYDTTYPLAARAGASAFVGTLEQCQTRVMRGGSWRNGSLNSFSPHWRNFDHANQRYPNLGFRVAAD